MKQLFLFVALTLFAACSKSPVSEQIADSAAKGSDLELQEPESSSTIYVNKAGYFEETDEFFVSLLPSRPMSEAYFNSLTDKAESVVFEDDGMARYSLPMAAAREAFDLSDLDRVRVYNDKHQFITKARLKRVEYVVDVNGYFVAVLKPENRISESDRGFYCLGMAKVELKGIEVEPIEDDALTERIKRELAIVPQYVWQVQHLKIQPYNAVYSLFAFNQENGEAVSYLTELKDDELKVLYKLKEEYTFHEIYPVPVEINGKPVLLLHIILPESDAMDDYILGAFEGSAYRLLDNYHVKLK